MNYVYIGGTPSEEACAAIGITDNAGRLNRLECTAYIVALRERYGNEPEGARLRILGQPHDFGTYYEVVCDFANDAASDYALRCERGIATWEEVGMWAPVTYDDANQPVRVMANAALWDRAANPDGATTLEAPIGEPASEGQP